MSLADNLVAGRALLPGIRLLARRETVARETFGWPLAAGWEPRDEWIVQAPGREIGEAEGWLTDSKEGRESSGRAFQRG